MTRRLTEAKVDLTSGISKSLSGSPLTVLEVEELKPLGIITLIVDHNLTSDKACLVVNHVKKESQRITYQQLMTRDQLSESKKLRKDEISPLEDPFDFSSI